MRAQFVYEKFKEDSDPIEDMGIGMLYKIKIFLKSIGEPFTNINTALVKCSLHGKFDFVKYLLDNGADANAGSGASLRYASYKGYIEIVKILLDAGANIHVFSDAAIRWASEAGQIDMVKLLIDRGAADVNTVKNWSFSSSVNDKIRDKNSKEKI